MRQRALAGEHHAVVDEPFLRDGVLELTAANAPTFFRTPNDIGVFKGAAAAGPVHEDEVFDVRSIEAAACERMQAGELKTVLELLVAAAKGLEV